MNSQEDSQIFDRSRRLLGEIKFSILQSSHVVVVGIGAVGSFAAEALVRSGVGHIRIVDADCIEMTNINRQLPALHSTLGMRKVLAARERLLDINPELDIEVLDMFVEAENMEQVFGLFSDQNSPDFVIDAIDSLTAKADLLTYCVRRGLKVFSSMGAARKWDSSCLRVADISKTSVCPLARRLRKLLKERGIFSGITCVFSVENAQPESHEAMHSTNPVRVKALGSLITVTGAVGLLLASEVLQAVVGGGVEGVD